MIGLKTYIKLSKTKMETEYKSENHEKSYDKDEIGELEERVFNQNIGYSPREAFKQASREITKIYEEAQDLDGILGGYFGKIISKFVPANVVVTFYVSKLEKNKAELESIVNRGKRKSEDINQKISGLEEAKGYAGILLERYDLMLDQMAKAKEEILEEIDKERQEAIKSNSNKMYKELEIESRLMGGDLRNVKMKQTRAAQKIVAYDRTIRSYVGLLAVVNKSVNKAEQAYLAAELRLSDIKTLVETGIASPDSVVSAIGKSVETGSTVEKLSENQKEGLYRAAEVMDSLPDVGISDGKRATGIEGKFIDSTAKENDKYLAEARKILERDKMGVENNLF